MCAFPGHLEGMFLGESISGWGMAPNKSSIQPDCLGLGTVRCQASGFLKVILLHATTAVTVFKENEDLQNSVEGPVTLQSIQEMVKALTMDQAATFVTKMAADTIYQCTLGVGTVIVCAAGSHK